MLKTFWAGIDGWADRQLPDGTVVWKAPTGRTYKTLPGSRIFFPAWDVTTAELPEKSTATAPSPSRGLMMPKRRRTRAAERAKRVQEERELNAAQRAEWARQAIQFEAARAAQRNKPPPTECEETFNIWDTRATTASDDDDPPPF